MKRRLPTPTTGAYSSDSHENFRRTLFAKEIEEDRVAFKIMRLLIKSTRQPKIRREQDRDG